MHGYKRKPHAGEAINAAGNDPWLKSSTGKDRFRSGEERGEAALIEITLRVRTYMWFRAHVLTFQQLELTGQATKGDHIDAEDYVWALRRAAEKLDEVLCDAGFSHAPPAECLPGLRIHHRVRCSFEAFTRLELIDEIKQDVKTGHRRGNPFCGEHSICGVRLFDHDAKHLAAWIPLVVQLYGKRASYMDLELDRLPIDREAAERLSGREFDWMMNNLPPAR